MSGGVISVPISPCQAPSETRFCTVTQTTPLPTATPAGRFPIRMVATTLLVFGSIREMVSSPAFATQTAPAPTAMPLGAFPTGTAIVEPVAGLIRETSSSDSFVTQTAPSPTAIPPGRRPTLIDRTTRSVLGSMRETLLSPVFATQIEPWPTATADGETPAIPWSTTRLRRGSMRLRVPEPDANQTLPRPNAIAPELDCLATGIVADTELTVESIRETEPTRPFAAQADPAPTAIPVAVASREIVPRRVFVAASSR